MGFFCNGNRITNVKLSVKLKTGDGVDVDKELIATFTVPNEPMSIHIRLDAEVKNMSQNSKQLLILLLYCCIVLYGKNCEGIAIKIW